MKMLGLVSVEAVVPNEWNAVELSEEDERKLKSQMRVSGPEKTEPITVRRVGEKWEIVNGEKRWRIARELGRKQIPAVEIDVPAQEAKMYCLSYNLLRGTVNYVKLQRLLLKDPEMVEVYHELLGKERAEQLIESAKKLTPEAEEILTEGVREGGMVTPEVIKIVSETPPEHQPSIAQIARIGTRESVVRSAVQRFIPTAEEEAEAEKPSKGKEPSKPKLGFSGKAAEVESIVDVEEPGVYLIYYDPEHRRVGIKAETINSKGFKIYTDQFTGPKTYNLILKCKCGRQWLGVIDASDGKYDFGLIEGLGPFSFTWLV